MRNRARSTLMIAGGIFIVFARSPHAQTMIDTNAEPAAAAAPGVDRRPPKVAPLFEQPGVLTPRGTYVLEPALQYHHASSERIAVAGYTLIPTLFPGLVDVHEVRHNSTVMSLTARRGITNRFEVEVRVPYVYRSDDTVIREMTPAGAVMDRVMQASGTTIGDVEFAARYQINEGSLHFPYFVGGLRFKTRTGRDAFEVVTDCTTRCTGPGASGTGLPLSLPTGSGFYALEPSLAWFLPSSPATFFGTFTYMHNFKRNNVSRTVLNGDSEPLGEISPGDSFTLNVGMGFALNDKASVSFGYEHVSIGRARHNHQAMPNSLRLQLGTIMAGFSYRIDNHRTVNVSIGGGLTRDAPDVGLMVRIPFAF